MRRRTFLGTASAAAVAAMSSSAEPVPIKLGFDTYSIRAFKWKAIQLLDYAAGLKLDTVQLSSLGDYESLEPAYLQQVKDHAARLGVAIDAGIGCICPSSTAYNKKDGTPEEYVTRGLRVAKAVGSSVLRCYMGTRADRHTPLPLEAHMEDTGTGAETAALAALDLGVRSRWKTTRATCRRARCGPSSKRRQGFRGRLLDTGNPMWVAEDPFVTLETLAPYVATSHVRDSAVFEHPRGAAAQWVSAGRWLGGFRALRGLYRKLCRGLRCSSRSSRAGRRKSCRISRRIIGKRFRKTPAWEFARFVALAKSGRPFLGSMVIGEWSDNSRCWKRRSKSSSGWTWERSLEYAKKKLGVGVRWRA